MKKAFVLSIVTLSVQITNAHPGGAHSHESILHEWAWIALPAIAAIGLIWKFGKKSYSSKKQ